MKMSLFLYKDYREGDNTLVHPIQKSYTPNFNRHDLYEVAFKKWQKYYTIANSEIYE